MKIIDSAFCFLLGKRYNWRKSFYRSETLTQQSQFNTIHDNAFILEKNIFVTQIICREKPSDPTPTAPIVSSFFGTFFKRGPEPNRNYQHNSKLAKNSLKIGIRKKSAITRSGGVHFKNYHIMIVSSFELLTIWNSSNCNWNTSLICPCNELKPIRNKIGGIARITKMTISRITKKWVAKSSYL